MNYHRYELGMSSDAMEALRQAILAGAFADRQATLRALIAHNNRTQIADSYERDLRALESGVAAFMNAKQVS